jgi:hypothetical protein
VREKEKQLSPDAQADSVAILFSLALSHPQLRLDGFAALQKGTLVNPLMFVVAMEVQGHETIERALRSSLEAVSSFK